ncbi:MAG: glycosyltransferase family 87 protein, partial [Gaiellaceae bacterium]
AVSSSVEPARSGPRVAWLASIALFGVLPVLTTIALFATTIQDGPIATDLRQFVGAAEAILDGESPYLPAGVPLTEWGGPYPYPPLPALAAIPLTVLPFDVAGVLVMAALVAAALATLRVLGVSDWRCYGLALLWPPVLSAVQTGNVTLWFGLAAALAWRYRDRLLPVSATVGLTLAVKFFLWPLVVWLAATRRLAGAVLSCVVGGALLLVSWAAIGFAGLVDYPDLVRRLEDTVGEDSYTLYIVGLDLGLPSGPARGLWLLFGLGLLAAVVVLGRRGDERSAFLLALAASIALTPIVWLHYFALLLVVVALAQPRLGFVWFVPLAMVITPGSGHPSPFETAATLAIAALTIGLALRASLGEQRAPEPSATPVRATAEAA